MQKNYLERACTILIQRAAGGREISWAEAVRLAKAEITPEVQVFCESGNVPISPASIRRDARIRDVMIAAGKKGNVLSYTEAMKIVRQFGL